MSSDINLLSSRNRELFKKEKQVKKVRIIAAGILFLVAFSSIASFFLNRNFSSSYKKEEDSLLREISLMHSKEAKLLIVKDRLQSIADILKTRVSYAKTTSVFLEKIPPEVQIEELQISQKSLTLSISSTSLASIDTVIKNFTDMAKQKQILKSLTLGSLTFVPRTGRYLTTLQATL